MSPQKGLELSASSSERYGTFSDSDTQWLRLQTIEGNIVGRKVSYSWCCSSSVLVRIAAVAVFAIAIFIAGVFLNECREIPESKFLCYTYISMIELLILTFLGTCLGMGIKVMEHKESLVEIGDGDSLLDGDTFEEITSSTEESSDPSSDEGSTDDEIAGHKMMYLKPGIPEIALIK